MTKQISAAILAATLMFGGSLAIPSAAAGPSQAVVQEQQASEAGELGARRRFRQHHHRIERQAYQSYYCDRPRDYAPTPFFPFLGLGYGPRGGKRV